MRAISLLILFSIVAAAASAQPVVDADSDAPLAFDPLTRTGELDNGLRWYLRPNQEPENRAELRLVLNAGSILEDDDQQGLAHFVEHMAFNGSEHFESNQLIDYMERIGMEFGPEVNAYTSFDETVYMLTVPTDDEAILDTALLILRDWAGGLSFVPEEIDRERGVVIEEWRGRRGAGQRVRDQVIPIQYADSRYAERLPIGKVEILENFGYESLTRYYRDWYRPDLMAIVAVGDFESDAMLARIKSLFSDLQGPSSPREREVFELPEHPATRFALARDPELTNSRVRVVLQSPAESMQTVADYRQSVVDGLWFRMLNDRLSELIQRADPPFVSAFGGSGQALRVVDETSLSVLVEDQGLETGLEAALVEAARAQRHGFTESELDRAKLRRFTALERQYKERENIPSARFASARAAHFLSGAPVLGIDILFALNAELLPTITLDEVNAAAPDFFAEENRVLVVTQPQKEGLQPPDEARLRASFSTVSAMQIEPYRDEVNEAALVSNPPEPGEIVSRDYDEDLGLHTWTLSNGVRVLLRPTDFKEDEILVGAYSPGGSSLGSDAEHLSTDLAGAIVPMMGLGEFSPPQLQKKLAGKQVSVRPYIGSLEEGFNGSCVPSDLPTLLELVYLYFTAPREDAELFGAMKQRYAAMLANRAASPEQAYSDSLSLILSQHHPRTLPMTVERLERVELAPAYAFFRDRFADAGDFSFVLVGSFEPEAIEPLIERWLGGLPSIDRVESWRDLGIRPPSKVVTQEVHRGSEPKARTTIVFTGDFEWSRDQRHAISSMAQVLEIRLRERLREDLSGTYGASVSASRQLYPIPSYSVRIAFGCDPLRLQELGDEVFASLAEFKTSGPTEDEMLKVKEQQRRQFEEGMLQNGSWMGLIGYRDRYQIPQRELLTTLEEINDLTADRVQAAAIRYLDIDRYVQVSLLPE